MNILGSLTNRKLKKYSLNLALGLLLASALAGPVLALESAAKARRWFKPLVTADGADTETAADDGRKCDVLREQASPKLGIELTIGVDGEERITGASASASGLGADAGCGSSATSDSAPRIVTPARPIFQTVSFNPQAMSPHQDLITAAGNGDIFGMRMALKRGADINGLATESRYLHGETALMVATRCKQPAAVAALLAVPGINVNQAEPRWGNTALIYAANLPTLELVREPSGKITRVPHDVATEIVALLLDKSPKLNINHKNKAGYTALDYAFLSDYYDSKLAVANLLLDHGADPVKGLSKKVVAAIQAFTDERAASVRYLKALNMQPAASVDSGARWRAEIVADWHEPAIMQVIAKARAEQQAWKSTTYDYLFVSDDDESDRE